MGRNDVNIDTAFESFQRILEQVDSAKGTIVTEQDTRLKVIDPILTRVLGWPLAEISTEEQAGSGFVDYKLTIRNVSIEMRHLPLEFSEATDGIRWCSVVG